MARADDASRALPPRRFRYRLFLILALASVSPLLLAGLGAWALLEGALTVAPPLGALLDRAALQIEQTHPGAALVGDLRLAELHLVQADLARRQLLERAPLFFVTALVASVSGAGVLAFLVGRRLSRPVEELSAAMARFGRGELEAPVSVATGPDEFRYLGDQMSRMGQELRAGRERLRVTEAAAAWRDAARALAHDLKNPLTAMRMALARLTRPGRTELALEEAAALLQEELEVLYRMSQSFSEYARLPAPKPQPLDFSALVRDVCTLYEEEANGQDGPRGPAPRLSFESRGESPISGDSDQLRRAVGNLVRNAIEASPPAAAIDVRIEAGEAAAQHPTVRLTIRDRGPGIDHRPNQADLLRGLPSHKAPGQRGLGLPIAHRIFHEHTGSLQLEPAQGGGTVAVVSLPLRRDLAQAPHTRVAS